ncbi:hypothetical protein CEXT_704261 [Caerostris extrusa]|uniref:Uncharacterized protein n=1 Tax=Caerostris extrusa TaxID=172846 RepID=A0AAV4XCK8_CAEEX|nr:hypothetical protein CEXT_704261 [Caerostris extrusa]
MGLPTGLEGKMALQGSPIECTYCGDFPRVGTGGVVEPTICEALVSKVTFRTNPSAGGAHRGKLLGQDLKVSHLPFIS